MQEIWKDIEGYEGKYQISNYGNVKSLNYRNSHKEKLLTPRTRDNDRKHKHLYVNLSNKNGVRDFYVHILVANAFIPNPNNLPIVHHIDWNPQNNNSENLMRVTVDKHNEIHGKCKAKVMCIETGVVYESIRQAANILNLSSGHISAVCNHKGRATEGGYHWKFL